MLDFKTIDINDRAVYKALLDKTIYENSEFSFATIFIWQTSYDMKLCKKDDVIYISATLPHTGAYVHFQPVCPNMTKLPHVFENIKKDMICCFNSYSCRICNFIWNNYMKSSCVWDTFCKRNRVIVTSIN